MHMLCMVVVLTALAGVARAQTAAAPKPKSPPAEPVPAVQLCTLSFNLRFDNPRDGEDRWEMRKDLVVQTIKAHDPDIVGVQEALMHQLEHVLNALPEYAYIGVGRDDGKHTGEYSAILYKKSAVAPTESGTFWLSDTPEIAGSRTWGNRVVRICTWARLRHNATGRAVWVYNAHLDHESQAAREKGLALIAQRMADRADTEPALLMGDFNAGEGNDAIRYITGRAESRPPRPLRDTFRIAHPDETNAGTFHGFKGVPQPEKIDYILVEPGAKVVKAEIDRRSFDGRYPSDHFPVLAVIRWE
jgi:endonuclease/exonuclease/phosphatase family metal-dependent hydrolase